MKSAVLALVMLSSVMLSSALLAPAPASAWVVDLPDSLSAGTGLVRLSDLSLTPVLPDAAGIVIADGGAPGETTMVTRQGVLRRLVVAGLAATVQMTGATRCVIRFGGGNLAPEALQAEAERVVNGLLPPTPAGAPAVWAAVTLPAGALSAAGSWSLESERREPLPAGRSQLRLVLRDGWQSRDLPVTVVVHAPGELAVARLGVQRDQPLDEGQFEWRWTDLSEIPGGMVVSRAQLQDASAARTMRAGDPLRSSDLKPTPVIRAGDSVELIVQRGSVAVSVRAMARQAGCLGQTIPVRNELTGRLVNARVAGPGVVEWRR
jgi:flagella basal body P-ring formation protein FlgA